MDERVSSDSRIGAVASVEGVENPARSLSACLYARGPKSPPVCLLHMATEALACFSVTLRIRERNSHWSGWGMKESSTKTELPSRCALPWNGSEIRLPKPPSTSVSWAGKSRSYASRRMVLDRPHARVMSAHPKFRASFAVTGSSKNSQAWPPLPDRDRSTATSRSSWCPASRYAATFCCQPVPSKSATRTEVSQFSPVT